MPYRHRQQIHLKQHQLCAQFLGSIIRYSFSFDAIESNKLQIEAHQKNHALLKPSSGMIIDKMVVISHKRMERSIKWITNYESYEQLRVSIDDILGSLTFGVKANKFEESFRQLGFLLGFCSERPDKEWKAGPDNLWGLRENEYLVVECKSEVKRDRVEINADEASQMNRTSAWFEAEYKKLSCQRWIVIPTRKLAKNTSFTHDVKILTKKGLHKLVRNVRNFTEQLSRVDFNHISERHVQQLMDASGLSVEDICSEYAEAVIRQ